MIKDMVLNLSLGPKEDATIDYAVSLASAFDARVTGIAFAYEKMPVGILGDQTWVGGLEELRQEAADDAKAAIARFEHSARGAGVAVETRWLETTFSGAADEFGRMARRFDLSIVRQAELKSGRADHLIIEAALFDSGRPMLVVPYVQKSGAKLDQVMVCWDSSRSAARAVADALPFLRRAKAVEILTIDYQAKSGTMLGADIADHLRLHGLNVGVKRIVAPDTDVPSTILSHAADTSADLIVLGGYGHSRVREFVLGGATRGILAAMTVPTLMSH